MAEFTEFGKDTGREIRENGLWFGSIGMSGDLAEKLHDCSSDVAVATVGDFGESEHFIEEIVVVAGDG